MNTDTLDKAILAIAVESKGILAADESNTSIKKKLDTIGLENTEENRRKYRELLFTSPLVENYISGVILFEETLMQSTQEGTLFTDLLTQRGMTPGIKVDKGLVDAGDGEQNTQGLDDLNERFQTYKKYNPRFAKWRAVYKITDVTPSDNVITQNARDLASYAKICQENNIIPIVEPEVLMDGTHPIEKCQEVTTKVLKKVFEELNNSQIYLEGILLKPNMIAPGNQSPKAPTDVVADLTVQVLREVVPQNVPCVCFLSGGQTSQEATAHLNSMVKNHPNLPWYLTFSYGRALQDEVVKAWQGKDENYQQAQQAFLNRAKLNSLATQGKYDESMEA